MQTNCASSDENNMAIHFVAAHAVHMTFKSQIIYIWKNFYSHSYSSCYFLMVFLKTIWAYRLAIMQV